MTGLVVAGPFMPDEDREDPGRVARLAAQLAETSYSVTAHAKDIFHEDVDPASLRAVLEDAHTAVTVSDPNAEHLRAVGRCSAAEAAQLAAALLEGYGATAALERRAAAYAAATCVRLACVYAVRPAWRHLPGPLLEAAAGGPRS